MIWLSVVFNYILLQVEYPFGKPFEDDSIYEDFDMDEVDINFENYEELFGNTRNNSEMLFDNGGIDSLFAIKDKCAADSTCHGEAVAEVCSEFYLILWLYNQSSMSISLYQFKP